MFSYIWPIALVVLSNVVYQICAKSVPDNADPFLSLTFTYLVGALVCAVIFLFSRDRSESLLKELGKINWSSYLLGIVIVGLEVGFIFAYKAGWQVSTASIVQSAFLAVALVAVGFIVYKEKITWTKAVGVLISLVGLVFINI